MHNAFKYAEKRKFAKTIIIGSDSPTLPSKFIEEAFERLGDHDVVIGPSRDGGYYLIGLKRPCLRLFQRVPCSSPGVLASTVQNAAKNKKRLFLLKEWYDVDDEESLYYLKGKLRRTQDRNRARQTRKALGL